MDVLKRSVDRKAWIATTAVVAMLIGHGASHADQLSSAPAAADAAVNSTEAETVETPAVDDAVELVEKPKPLFQHKSYPAAWTAAQESGRPILLYVSMPSCPHCDKMVDQTYRLPMIEQLVKSSFETVRVGRFTHAKLVSQLHVKWYPTTILVSPNNKVLDKIEGYVDAKTFNRRLQTGLAAVQTPTQTR